ncbi:MAG TPA: NAD-dependent epimerase/dehydratase family protein [Chryseosolibacter sp.]
MKVLITGANGLLGANVAHTLFRAGEQVVLFVRPNADLSSIADLPCEVIFGDIQDADAVWRAVQQVDAVVHAASTTDMTPQPFAYYESININGTKNVTNALLASPGKRLIYVSTANTFAPGSKALPGNELNGFSFFDFNSGYINSKYIAQQIVLESVERHGLDAVVVNPTFMLGAYDAKPSSGKIILFGIRPGITWCPPGGKNFVSVRDVANGIHAALYEGKKGQCYLLTGENLSYKEFFRMLHDTTGSSSRLVVIPKPLMIVGGMIGSAMNALNLRKVSFNLTNVRLLSVENYYSGIKAQTEFRLRLTPVKVAIAEALEWFKNNGLIKTP